jgi:hypothetical protein
MKKNLLGFAAVVLAISFSAFTSYRAPIQFTYTNGTTYGAAVENETLYLKGSPSGSCLTSAFACAVTIPDAYIVNPNGTTLSAVAPNVEVIRSGNAILAVQDATTHTAISGAVKNNKSTQ